MGKIGIKNLTYARYQSGGEGTPIVYSGGVQKLDYMVRGEITVDYANESEFADDHKIDVDNSATGVHQNMELSNLDTDMLECFAGLVAAEGNNTGAYSLTDTGAPFIGCGWLMVNRFKGVVTYEGIWVHKIKYRRESVAADTKAENLAFGHENVAGDGVGVQLAAGGAVVYYEMIVGQATEAAVNTWLKGKAGIT